MNKQKMFKTCLWLSFALTVLLPAGMIICAFIKWKFTYNSYIVMAVVTLVISFVTCILYKSEYAGSREQEILLILMPLTMINTMLYTIKSSSIPATVMILLSAACIFVMALECREHQAGKIWSIVLMIILSLLTTGNGFLWFTFGQIGVKTVTDSALSPDAKYLAEVIDDDQGALGGNTLVNVSRDFKINALVFTVAPKPECVYTGKYWEYKDMTIDWADNDTLLINGKEYDI